MTAFVLGKMRTELASPVNYFMCDQDGNAVCHVNDFIDKTLTIRHTGNFFCVQCNRSVKKLFQQGHCYPCFTRLRECNLCIIHPERCRVMSHGCPKDDWAHRQCHGEHVVYLAYTSHLKVGITRMSNVPSRWIDQGAVAALPILKTDNRALAGKAEVLLKGHVADKTNWRNMLKGSPEYDQLQQDKRLILSAVQEPLQALMDEHEGLIHAYPADEYHIQYPVLQYPEKISSLSLEKTPEVSGHCVGIKAQYCIFEHGVMNIRKFSGYEVEVS